jgi:hypothetical protein
VGGLQEREKLHPPRKVPPREMDRFGSCGQPITRGQITLFGRTLRLPEENLPGQEIRLPNIGNTSCKSEFEFCLMQIEHSFEFLQVIQRFELRCDSEVELKFNFLLTPAEDFTLQFRDRL